jgi:hypothetical protein
MNIVCAVYQQCGLCSAAHSFLHALSFPSSLPLIILLLQNLHFEVLRAKALFSGLFYLALELEDGGIEVIEMCAVAGLVNPEIPIIENSLKHYGQVKMDRGQVRILTLNTILSALIVAGIVSLALLAHRLNEDFFKEVFDIIKSR